MTDSGGSVDPVKALEGLLESLRYSARYDAYGWAGDAIEGARIDGKVAAYEDAADQVDGVLRSLTPQSGRADG